MGILLKDNRAFIMFKVLLTVALIGAASADLTCEDCSDIGTRTSAEWIRDEAISAEVGLIEEAVCSQAPDMETCEAELPQFWKYIALALFDPATGWYSPSSLCSDVCVKKTFLAHLTCDECSARLYTSTEFMADEETIAGVVSAFIGSDFCSSIYGEDNVADCNEGIEIVVPTALRIFATTEDQWINGWCKDLGCE